MPSMRRPRSVSPSGDRYPIRQAPAASVSPASGTRRRINSGCVANGKMGVLNDVESVGDRCNPKLRGNNEGKLTLKDDIVKPAGEMQCDATVYTSSTQVAGRYDSTQSIHAEMAALSIYITGNNRFKDITKIVITSPPCKSCAYVLELFGVIGKVETTEPIYKKHTSAWRWPEALKNFAIFNGAYFDICRWNAVKGMFEGSGLTDTEVLGEVVNVVERGSSL